MVGGPTYFWDRLPPVRPNVSEAWRSHHREWVDGEWQSAPINANTTTADLVVEYKFPTLHGSAPSCDTRCTIDVIMPKGDDLCIHRRLIFEVRVRYRGVDGWSVASLKFVKKGGVVVPVNNILSHTVAQSFPLAYGQDAIDTNELSLFPMILAPQISSGPWKILGRHWNGIDIENNDLLTHQGLDSLPLTDDPESVSYEPGNSYEWAAGNRNLGQDGQPRVISLSLSYCYETNSWHYTV
jgi:hypothetical protein